jgi:hypothetical protein
MKMIIGLMVALSVFTPMLQSDIKLEIGAKLPRKYIPRKITQQIATSPSQGRPYVRKTIADVDYIIAFNEESREIRYIQTYDKDFRTVNGLQVGSEITFTREQLDIFPSWEIRAPATPDGWYPVVAHDIPMLGGDFVDKLKDGEPATMTIGSFSKGDN